MTDKKPQVQIQQERTYPRFDLGQRWEHGLLVISATVLMLTGLPQKFRDLSWSQYLLSTPHRLEIFQQIHHIAALVLILEALYHIGKAIYQLSKRKLSAEFFPTMQDVKDAGHMLQYLFFLRKDKPKYGKYNFEQKVTYWVVFLGFLLMIISGLIIWFPIFFTDYLPGGIIPAAKLMHSTEAMVATIFILIWHFYHVHIERLNLSIFTGRLSEKEMKVYHSREYERLNRKSSKEINKPGDRK